MNEMAKNVLVWLVIGLVLLGLLFWLWKRRRDKQEDPQEERNAQVRS